MSEGRITTDDYLAELQRVGLTGPKYAEGFSSLEFCEALGVNENAGRRARCAAIRAGTIRYAGKSPRKTVCGHMLPVPVYRVVEEPSP